MAELNKINLNSQTEKLKNVVQAADIKFTANGEIILKMSFANQVFQEWSIEKRTLY